MTEQEMQRLKWRDSQRRWRATHPERVRAVWRRYRIEVIERDLGRLRDELAALQREI